METQNAIPLIGNMVLKTDVLKVINTPRHRVELARIMGVGEQSIIKYIASNDVKLTQYAPLEYIKKVMGCLDASEVLEPKKEDQCNS